jgi:hypothetical protein
MNSFRFRHALPLLALAAAAAQAQTHDNLADTGRTAGRIATQPARDIGARKIEVPPAVQRAAAGPYSLAAAASCAQIHRAIADLDADLGPDFDGRDTSHESRVGKLAEAGGQTVVNTLIPFRSLVRELSGAAPAERRLNRALDAAYARRGFLRGLAAARHCRL